jgi:hypothetical protein
MSTYRVTAAVECEELSATIAECRQIAAESGNSSGIDFVKQCDICQPEVGEIVIGDVENNISFPVLYQKVARMRNRKCGK